MAASVAMASALPKAEIIWASPRELLNIVQADAVGCQIITVTHDILKKLPTLGYGLDADAAFAMLKWWSRNRNVKVRDVADRLIQGAREGHVSHPGLRRLLDGLLDDLTTRRIP